MLIMTRPAKRPKRNTGPWSSSRILNSSTPIVGKDILAFLVTCISGWQENYDEEEKHAIIDSLPPHYRKYDVDESGRLKCPVSVDLVLKDSHLKAAVARFKNDVSEGHYEKAWQNRARKAMQERQEGRFDEYLEQHAEEMFGEQPDDGSQNADDQTEDHSSDGEWGKKSVQDKKSGR